MASEDSLSALTQSIFDHLPLLFTCQPAEAQAALNAAGYRMARQPNGQPMLARPVGNDFVAIVVAPGQPAKVKLMGDKAADLFDRLVAEVEAKGFERAASESPRPGMRIETLSATKPGPIMTVSVTRALESDTVLLAAVVPSRISPDAPAG